MLQPDVSPSVLPPAMAGSVFQNPPAAPQRRPAANPVGAAEQASPDEEWEAIEWSEDDIVFLHWRLLQEVRHLADPAAPLGEKLDTLRWVFTER